jgi:hypothetical protein
MLWWHATVGGGLDSTTAQRQLIFVLCLTAVTSLNAEYKNLISHTEENKCNCPLSNQFLIPTEAASVMPPVTMALAFREGGYLTGALHFNGAFIIPFLCSLLPIKLYGSMMQYQLQDLAISSMSSLPPQILLGAGTLCAHGQEIVQDVSWLPNFTG